jgi:hypothetical protein
LSKKPMAVTAEDASAVTVFFLVHGRPKQA